MGLQDAVRDISNLGLIALTLGISIITITVFSIVLDEFQEDQTLSNIVTTNNESIDLTDGSALLTSFARGTPTETGSVVTNGTNNTIGVTNYQLNGNFSFILESGASQASALGLTPNLNVTYDTDLGIIFTASGNVTQKGLQTELALTDSMPLLGTVIILGIIISVILGLFIGIRGRRQGGF